MDDEIRKIIHKTFTGEDSEIVEEMLDVIERDMSGMSKAKRTRELDEILSRGK